MIATARLRWAIVIGLLVLYPFVYARMYAGDAVLHLAFAEHAAEGRPYEFNPGERIAGVTSPGYMWAIAGLFRILPKAGVPLAVKALDIAAWYGLIWVTFVLARRLLDTPRLAALVAAGAGLVPGSCYNATGGMENGIFALAVWLAVSCGMKAQETRGDDVPRMTATWRREAAHTAAWAAAVWLRPEGLVAAAIWFVIRGRTADVARASKRRLAISALFVAAAAASAAVVLHAYTGLWLPTSGRSRVWLAFLNAWHIGPFWFDPGFLQRLLAYAPVTALAAVGARCAWRRGDDTQTAVWRFCVAILAVFGATYSFAFGALHLSRYAIFLMPALFLLAGLGLQEAERLRWTRRRFWRPVAAIAAAYLAVVFVAETIVRFRMGRQDAVAEAVTAPAERTRRTDEFLARLHDPAQRPVTIALWEVQVRYFFDDRIVIRSLDGRTDPVLLEFVSRDGIDYEGYLRRRKVGYLVKLVDYVEQPRSWSLATLATLPPDGQAVHNGTVFTRLGSDIIVAIRYPPGR